MGRAGEAQEAAVDVEALNGFMRAAKAAAASGGTPVTLVMGNEAADLDSMAGPLIHSAFTRTERREAPVRLSCRRLRR
jgi:hypothetical protein